MFNIIKIVEEAVADNFARPLRTWSFTKGISRLTPRINVGGTVYDAVLTIDEEVPETPLSDG